MKNLIKGEFYVLLKQKSKFILIPLLMLTYFIGVTFANGSHSTYFNQEQKEYVEIFRITAQQRDIDSCILGEVINLESTRLCGKKYFSDEKIISAQNRSTLNNDFSANLNRMNESMLNKDKINYLKHRSKMLNSAKAMEKAGFNNGYYIVNDLVHPIDDIVVENELIMIKDILTNDYSIHFSPFEINANNYLVVFFSNGGMIALLAFILIFNKDFFVNEDNLSVNNVVYTQNYSRAEINTAKIIVSILYSLIALVISLLLSHLILGVIFGFGSLGYPVLIRSNINSFATTSLNTFVISTVGKQMVYISVLLFLILLGSLLVMHLVTLIFQNSNTGLFFVYILLGLRIIVRNLKTSFLKYFPFAYDNAKEVFSNNYNFTYGVLSLVSIIICVFSILVYVGNRLDIKGGD